MRKRKSVAIVIVWGILIMLVMLAMAAVRLMGNQGAITENSVRRMRAFYTAKAAIVHALEVCRTEGCLDGDSVALNNMDALIKVESAPPAAPCNNCEKITVQVIY